MSELSVSGSCSLLTYELNADDFELQAGETVFPRCEIGIDSRSGSPVYMQGWGRVTAVYYKPANHSYLVTLNQI